VKTLSPGELIELIVPDQAMVDAALRRFDATAPALCREPGYCRQLVAEGFLEAAVIHWQGEPAFFLCWRMTSDRGLWIDIAQTLSAGAPTDVLFDGVALLADREHARYIRFLTMRRGLVKLAQQRGYQPEAVLLVQPQ